MMKRKNNSYCKWLKQIENYPNKLHQASSEASLNQYGYAIIILTASALCNHPYNKKLNGILIKMNEFITLWGFQLLQGVEHFVFYRSHRILIFCKKNVVNKCKKLKGPDLNLDFEIFHRHYEPP